MSTPKYEVVVGNIGTVHSGDDEAIARSTYDTYVELSRFGAGRASGEDVALFEDGELIAEHSGRSQEGEQ